MATIRNLRDLIEAHEDISTQRPMTSGGAARARARQRAGCPPRSLQAAAAALCFFLLGNVARAQGLADLIASGPEQCQDDSMPDEFGEGGGAGSNDECVDWDVLMGLQCDNDFPPGELPGDAPEDEDPGNEPSGGDSGGETGGGEPGGGDVTIEELDCDNCEVLETDGGVIIWIHEDDTGGGGGSGDTGSSAQMGDDSAFAAYVFDHVALGGQVLLTNSWEAPSFVAVHTLVGRRLIRRNDGSVLVTIDLSTAYSSTPIAPKHRFLIGKCSTAVRALE